MSEPPQAQGAMTRAAEQALRLIPKADGCFVTLVEGEQLVEAYRAGSFEGPEVRVNVSETLSGLSLLSGEAFRCDDVDSHPFVDHATAKQVGVGSFVCAPLRDGIRAFGAFIAASKARTAFTDDDVAMLAATAQSLENELAPHAKRVRRFVRS